MQPRWDGAWDGAWDRWDGAVAALVLVVLVGGLAALHAQPTLTVTLKPQTPFQITWDQPPAEGAIGVNFRWWCDGGIVKNFTAAEAVGKVPANADGTTTYTATAPGLSAGSHSCLVSAFNDFGESKSAPIPITVGVVPGTPIKLKVVVVVGGE